MRSHGDPIFCRVLYRRWIAYYLKLSFAPFIIGSFQNYARRVRLFQAIVHIGFLNYYGGVATRLSGVTFGGVSTRPSVVTCTRAECADGIVTGLAPRYHTFRTTQL